MATVRRVLLLLFVAAAVAAGAYGGYTLRHNRNAAEQRAVAADTSVATAPAGSSVTTPAAANSSATSTASGPSGVVRRGDLPTTGACYETHHATSPDDDVTPVPRSCDGPHNTVVVSQEQFTDPLGTPYDAQRVLAGADELCRTPADAFTSGSSARFTNLSIYPGRTSWEAGDRTVVCLVRREGGDVSGPLTQS